MRRYLTLLLTLLVNPALAQSDMHLGMDRMVGPTGVIVSSGCAGSPPLLDGSVNTGSPASDVTVTLPVAHSPETLIVGLIANIDAGGVNNVQSITDDQTGGSSRWTRRQTTGGQYPNDEWQGRLTSVPSGGTMQVTIHFPPTTSPSFLELEAVGVYGTWNNASPFDGSGVITSTVDPWSVTTTCANDFVLAVGSASVSNPVAGACCTQIVGGTNNFLVMYARRTVAGAFTLNTGSAPSMYAGALVDFIKGP